MIGCRGALLDPLDGGYGRIIVRFRDRNAARTGGRAGRGLMSERPLLISAFIEHASRYHGDVEIASRLVDRSIHRYTYAEAERRSRRLARALLRLGIKPGDRVGTLAWNNYRHFELYYG